MRRENDRHLFSEVTAVAEVALQFAGFKNVDLFTQGIYQVRASARGERSGRTAMPVSLAELGSKDQPMTTANREALLPALVLERTDEVCTQSFRVRYCEEEVLLRSLCRLRVELSMGTPELRDMLAPPPGRYECEPIEIELRRMHASSKTVFDAKGDVEEQSLKHFSAVATQKLRLRLPMRGGSCFFPLTFDEWHFCYAPLLVHGTRCSRLASYWGQYSLTTH